MCANGLRQQDMRQPCVLLGRSAAFTNDEIKYFIEEEHKQNYDLSVQLHLNAFNGEAYGCEAYCYNAKWTAGSPADQREARHCLA